MKASTQTSKSKISGYFEEVKRPLIPEGDYVTTIKNWEAMQMFDRYKLIIHCEIYEGEKLHLIAYFCNLILDENKKIKLPGKRSNFHKMVKSLLKQNDNLYNLDDLIGLKCIATVGTCTTDDKKQNKPESEHYSVIRTFRLIQELPDEIQDDDMPF